MNRNTAISLSEKHSYCREKETLMDLIKEKWDQILLNVMQEHEISDIAFRTWLKPLTVHRVTDNDRDRI